MKEITLLLKHAARHKIGLALGHEPHQAQEELCRRRSLKRYGAKLPKLTVHVVRRLQPLLYFRINVLERRDLDPVRDAILLGEAASVDKSFWNF